MIHQSVLLKEVIEYLNPKPGDKIIDATLGGGGHAIAIAERVAPNGKVLGIEWDSKLLKEFELKSFKVSEFKNNFILINGNYRNLKKIAEENDFIGADGILLDLGLSSWHLNQSGRGFSFQPRRQRVGVPTSEGASGKDSYRNSSGEPLDMRYSSATKLTAAEIVNMWPPEEIEKILKEYGEEKFAKLISKSIIETRKKKPIISTFQLVEAIKKAVPLWYQRRRLHFATKTFQALRIAVNDELGNLEAALGQLPEVLKEESRGAVISFHSLEDRIVKNRFKEFKKAGIAEIITKKPVRPTKEEIAQNPRSRSAKLRVIERI